MMEWMNDWMIEWCSDDHDDDDDDENDKGDDVNGMALWQSWLSLVSVIHIDIILLNSHNVNPKIFFIWICSWSQGIWPQKILPPLLCNYFYSNHIDLPIIYDTLKNQKNFMIIFSSYKVL